MAASVSCPSCDSTSWRFAFHRQGWDFVDCRGCGLRRLDPLPDTSVLADHYSQRAGSGNYEEGKAQERRRTLEHVFEFVGAAGARSAGRLFDLGCFDGGLLDIACSAGWETWGLELQGEAVERARARHGARVLVGTIEEFVVTDPGTFDVVTAIGVIEHLRNPRRLAEIARELLRPGGLLALQTPNRRSVPARLLGRRWPCIAAPEHIWYFDGDTLSRLLARHGFGSFDHSAHWKPLRLGYAYDQFEFFGPEFHKVLGPLVRHSPQRVLDARLRLYGGEMLCSARRSIESV